MLGQFRSCLWASSLWRTRCLLLLVLVGDSDAGDDSDKRHIRDIGDICDNGDDVTIVMRVTVVTTV
jgi:hypothetical protein